MPTPDLSDDELDALFRQGAEHFPEELNLGAWSRMEQRLDEEAIQRAANRKVARFFAAEMAAVALLLLLWLGYRQVEREMEQPAVAKMEAGAITNPSVAGPAVGDAETPAARPAPEVAASEPRRSAPLQAAQAQRPMESVGADASPADATPNSGTSTETAAIIDKRRRAKTLVAAASLVRRTASRMAEEGRSQLARAARAEQPSAASALAAQGSSARNQSTPNPATIPAGATKALAGATPASGSAVTSGAPVLIVGSAKQAAIVTDAAQSPSANQLANLAAATDQAATTPGQAGAAPTVAPTSDTSVTAAAPASASSTTDSTATAKAPAVAAGAPTAPTDSAAPTERKRAMPTHRLLLGAVYAPELSTVGRAGYTNPGSNFGIVLEYRFLPRWRVSAGAIRSVKLYEARGTDYTFPYGPPAYPIDRIDADCHIIDVPLNLRFEALSRTNHSLFVSGGLSSLLMRSERYGYDYDYQGQTITREWEVRNGSNHFLSVLNLSAGYERQLGARWSVQAEPYAKLPLGGVGAGKVRLRSGGVFVGLKYGF